MIAAIHGNLTICLSFVDPNKGRGPMPDQFAEFETMIACVFRLIHTVVFEYMGVYLCRCFFR